MPPVEVSIPIASKVYTDTRHSSPIGHGNYGADLDSLGSSCRPCGIFSSLSVRSWLISSVALLALCILLQVFALDGYTTRKFSIVLYAWVGRLSTRSDSS
jgi:hypothetical protein